MFPDAGKGQCFRTRLPQFSRIPFMFLHPKRSNDSGACSRIYAGTDQCRVKCTHAREHTHTHTCARTHACKQTHSYIHARMHTLTQRELHDIVEFYYILFLVECMDIITDIFCRSILTTYIKWSVFYLHTYTLLPTSIMVNLSSLQSANQEVQIKNRKGCFT